MPKMKRTFEVEIEAKLVVDAFDEFSARKKAEKILNGRARELAPDVFTSGQGWTYDAQLVEAAS